MRPAFEMGNGNSKEVEQVVSFKTQVSPVFLIVTVKRIVLL